jgi:MFS family permease
MLLVLFLISTSSYLDRNIVAVALEPIKREFHLSDTMLGVLSGAAFAVFYVSLAIPVARLADRGDRRLIITAAMTIWSLMTTLCGLATGYWQLALARMGVGAGEAAAMAPAQGLIADYFPPERRASAIGLFMMSVTAGNVLAMVGGGWIAQSFGWRGLFLVSGLFGLGLAPVAFLTLKEPRALGRLRRLQTGETFFASIRALSAKRSYRLIAAAITLFFVVAFGPMAFIIPFLMRVHHLSLANAGALFGLLTAVGGVLGNLIGGVLTDRLARRDIRWLGAVPGIGLLALCGLYQAAFMAHAQIVSLALLFWAGMVFAAVYPPMYAALHAVCGATRRVTALAIALSLGNLAGLGLGPVAVGLISDLIGRSMGPAVGLQYALCISMGLAVPAGLLFLLASRVIPADAEP